jgi:hypothetical protein
MKANVKQMNAERRYQKFMDIPLYKEFIIPDVLKTKFSSCSKACAMISINDQLRAGIMSCLKRFPIPCKKLLLIDLLKKNPLSNMKMGMWKEYISMKTGLFQHPSPLLRC